MKISAAGLFLLCAFALCGCASESVMLVNPKTGASVKCGAAGSGLMAGAAGGMVDECAKKYEPQGYVTVEKLTPGERADLERRGVLTPTVEQRPSMY